MGLFGRLVRQDAHCRSARHAVPQELSRPFLKGFEYRGADDHVLDDLGPEQCDGVFDGSHLLSDTRESRIDQAKRLQCECRVERNCLSDFGQGTVRFVQLSKDVFNGCGQTRKGDNAVKKFVNSTWIAHDTSGAVRPLLPKALSCVQSISARLSGGRCVKHFPRGNGWACWPFSPGRTRTAPLTSSLLPTRTILPVRPSCSVTFATKAGPCFFQVISPNGFRRCTPAPIRRNNHLWCRASGT